MIFFKGYLMEKIGIIGSGTVGGTTGKVWKTLGNQVLFYDISEQIVLPLKDSGYSVAANIEEIIHQTDISFVCVDAPTYTNGDQNLSYVMSVLYEIADALNKMVGYHLIVFRSTLLPGTMSNVILPILERYCQKVRGIDYDICYNPEFLRENSALIDAFNPDRIIIGEDRKNASLQLAELYQQLRTKIIITSFESAEMIKYASNCFLALKISFFNEIGLACKRMGIDDKIVSEGVSLDKRIGAYGTVAGKPFGGKCLPKDSLAWVSFAKKMQVQPDLVAVAFELNRLLEEVHPETVEATQIEFGSAE
jgi:UDPglucose 6-dehydrogenase